MKDEISINFLTVLETFEWNNETSNIWLGLKLKSFKNGTCEIEILKVNRYATREMKLKNEK